MRSGASVNPPSDVRSASARWRRQRARVFGSPLFLVPFAAAFSMSMAAEPGLDAASAHARTPFTELVPQATLHVGKTADWVLVTSDSVWTGSTGPNAVHRIDPRSDTLTA